MHFRMYERGIYYYVTEDEDFVFVNTVTDNKESHSKEQINASEQAR